MTDHVTPDDLRYTEDHEWARLEDGRVRVGITDYAQDALTDVVYVELPDVDDAFTRGEPMAIVESVKSVSDVYAPVGGRVVERNERLHDEPEHVNDDPFGEGWFVVLEPEDASQMDDLLTADAYRASLEA